jgi:ferredoxin--NADP+ reductase
LKHIYSERSDWEGKVRLFYGAKTGLDLLYQNDENDDLVNYYDQETFEAFQALSPRPHADEPVDMLSTLQQRAREVWEMIQDPKTHVYIAGLSKLEDQIDRVLVDFAGSEGVWKEQKAQLITERRWSTLFYN